MSPSVSVIVPTHNRIDDVVETLGHLLQARSSTNFEIVVVDDGSDPPISLKFPHIRLLRTSGVERSRARNLGATVARGTSLIFLDDDITIPVGFIAAHERAATEFGDALCVGGISLPAEWGRTPFGRFRQLIEGPSQAKPRGLVMERNFCTAQNMSMRRDTFLSIGGFDPEIVSSEDQDLALRFSEQGGRIVFLPEASAVHRDFAMNIASYCRRHEWGSRAMAPFLRRYPDLADNGPRLRFDSSFSDLVSARERSALLIRQSLSQRPLLRLLLGAASVCEKMGAGDNVLFPIYRVLLGLHLFRGFREGLREMRISPPLPEPIAKDATRR